MLEECSISVIVCKGTLVEIHCQLVEMYGLCVYRVDVVPCF